MSLKYERIKCNVCNKNRLVAFYQHDKKTCDSCYKKLHPKIKTKRVCIKCNKENAKYRRYGFNKDICYNCITEKQCCKCKQIKNLKHFYKNNKNNDKHYGTCKSCHKTIVNNTVINNKEKYKKINLDANEKYRKTSKFRVTLSKWHKKRVEDCHPMYLKDLLNIRKHGNFKITKENIDNYTDLISLEKDKLKLERKIKTIVKNTS